MTTQPTCSTCPYGTKLNEKLIECRREPPQIFFIGLSAHPLNPKQQVPMTEFSFPRMRNDLWCGEHPVIQMRLELAAREAIGLPEANADTTETKQ
jgi:hypothetical protein